jgi:hypothetical protein
MVKGIRAYGPKQRRAIRRKNREERDVPKRNIKATQIVSNDWADAPSSVNKEDV